MRNKLIAALATIAVVFVLGVPSARAGQITLGDSCSGTLNVTPGAPPTVGGTVTGCGATWESGPGPWSDVGQFSITGGTDLATGTFTDGTSTISGTINWTNFVGSTLEGWFTVSTVDGFSGEFTSNGVYWIDLTFKPDLPNSPSCQADGNTLYGCAVSGGEILTTVPEPGTLTLLGTGLLTMAGFLRRKLSA
jgi:PEP-CTERM motif